MGGERLTLHSLCSLLGVFCLQLPSLVSDSSYVCCEYVLLPLVNKEAALAYGRAEYSKVKIQAEIEEERGRVKQTPCSF